MQHHIIRLENGDYFLSCFLDDISYKVQRTGEKYVYTFLAYCVQEVERAFATVSYDDIRFFTTVQSLANPWSTPSFFVQGEERIESVDLRAFKQTMDARVLAEHPI